MRYIINSSFLPENQELLNLLESASERLYNKLSSVSFDKLEISDYSKKYIGNYIKYLRATLQVKVFILASGLARNKISTDKIVFVDYGGGTGLLSLLAKELGVGTVIYNDIYDLSCRDARIIAKAINLDADEYVCGDIEILSEYIQKKKLKLNVIASYEVLEHIYNINCFFKVLSTIPQESLSIVFASTANIHNPIIRKNRMKLQQKAEYEDRIKEYGHKERDTTKSYFNVRKEIISEFAPFLSFDQVEKLARSTRGKIKEDILEVVAKYLNTGKIESKLPILTNTCDPYTGNWAEHLIETNYLKELLSEMGFHVEIKPGYYAYSCNPMKQFIKSLLNRAIKMLGSKGLLISPFYMVHAYKD